MPGAPSIPNPPPADEQGNPYLPPGPEPLLFQDFLGIDTQATRVGVDDKMMYWCSGFFPIAPMNLRTLYGIGSSIFTTPGATIVFFAFANIGPLPIAVVFLADGSIWQVATTTNVATQIAGPGTIVNPNPTTTGISQWGSQYILIVNNQRANGFFIWDGLVLYQAGTLAPPVTITDAGSGYTSAPTVTASGGSGSGATFSVTLTESDGITSVTVNYGGSYLTQSAAFAISGGGGSGAVLSVGSWSGTPNQWSIASVSIVSPGSGYTSAPTIVVNTFSGNQRAQANVTCAIGSSGSISEITITNPGTGYAAGDTPTLSITGGGGSGGTATVNIMPYGVQGTGIETYSGRVWIINGNDLQFSAPGSFIDFSSGDGGGAVTSSDSFLRVGYTALIQTNGFLYVIADSSINYISGVQTSGTPPVTTYTNQNADPEVGTPYSATALVFGRNIMMVNSVGVHVSYGAAVTKVSTALDGVFNTVDNFNGLQLSAAKATIFGKKVFMALIPVIDPVTNASSNEIFMWDGQKKWWSSKQDTTITFIAAQEINSELTAWGTDGGNLFQLFAQPSINFTKTVQSKLWTRPGGYQFTKAPVRFWALTQYYGTEDQPVTLTVDSETTSQEYTLSSVAGTVTWRNSSNQIATWTNSSAHVATWSLVETGIQYFEISVGQAGVLSGMTLSTECNDMAIISAMMQDEIVAYRG